MGILEGNIAQAILDAVNGFFGADEGTARDLPTGKNAEELSAMKAEYERQTGQSLEEKLSNWDDADADVALRLLNPPEDDDDQAQAGASAEILYLAVVPTRRPYAVN
jgi:hypothetical protein